MKTSNGLKHTILGIVVGIGIVTSVAAIKTGPYSVGRFEMGRGMLDKAFVIDSVTGQVWDQDHPEFANPKMDKPKF